MPKIHPAFSSALPELHPMERQQLKKNIEAEGKCLDWIETWHDFVVDGHNRLEICEELGWKAGEKFNYAPLDDAFKTESEVLNYINEKHLGRRNMSKETRDKVIYALYPTVKARVQSDPSPGKIGSTGNAARDIARDLGVSEKTAKRAVAKGKKGDETLNSLPQYTKKAAASENLTPKELERVAASDRKAEVERSLRVGQADTLREAWMLVHGKPILQTKVAKPDKPPPDKKAEVKDPPPAPVSKRLQGQIDTIKKSVNILDELAGLDTKGKSLRDQAAKGLDVAYQALCKWKKERVARE